MFLSEHSSVQPHLRKDRKKVQDDHKFKKLRFEEDFKEPMSRKEKMRDKIVRPQSVLPMERSMMYYSENSTGFIAPVKTTPHSPTHSLNASPQLHLKSRRSSSKKRENLLPFSESTVLKLNRYSLSRSPVRRTAAQSTTPMATLDNPVNPMVPRPQSGSSKFPIIARPQASRPQSSFSRHTSAHSPKPMNVSQYRNYLIHLHNAGTPKLPDAQLFEWMPLEKNAHPEVEQVPERGKQTRKGEKVSKVGFDIFKGSIQDDAFGYSRDWNQRKMFERNVNSMEYKETLKAVKKCNSWIDQNIEYLTPTPTPRPTSSIVAINSQHPFPIRIPVATNI